MNYRQVSTFGSGSCVSSFGSSLDVETATVSTFGPAQRSLMEKIKALLGTFLGRRHMKGSMVENKDECTLNPGH